MQLGSHVGLGKGHGLVYGKRQSGKRRLGRLFRLRQPIRPGRQGRIFRAGKPRKPCGLGCGFSLAEVNQPLARRKRPPYTPSFATNARAEMCVFPGRKQPGTGEGKSTKVRRQTWPVSTAQLGGEGQGKSPCHPDDGRGGVRHSWEFLVIFTGVTNLVSPPPAMNQADRDALKKAGLTLKRSTAMCRAAAQ